MDIPVFLCLFNGVIRLLLRLVSWFESLALMTFIIILLLLFIIVTSDGFLTVDNITFEDAGLYQCQAVNSVGSRRLNIQLQIVGKLYVHSYSLHLNNDGLH